MKEISIREWIENFNGGTFESTDFNTQVQAGWFDWFCRDESLANKTKRMGNIIKKIENEYILDNCYVFFKNNCPMCGPLYDSFRIRDLENGNVLFCISIADKREKCRYTVYGLDNGFKTPLYETNYSKELIRYLNNLNIK